MSERTIDPFITYLLRLNDDNHRGNLAALRRGLMLPPGEALEMYPYVARWVPVEARGTATERMYYLTAALYASYPENTGSGNFGDHMRAAARSESEPAATERRFVLLLNTDADDLADYLRQSVSFVKSKAVPVNWDQLFRDLKNWDHPDRYVQKRWANAFWANSTFDEA